MRKYFLIYIATMLLSFSYASAQQNMSEVVTELSGHSIDRVVKYFDKVVDITLNNNQSTYSRTQAEKVVKNFMIKNEVSTFQVKYKGYASEDESFYLIGDLKTVGHGVFRVYFFFKQKGNEHFLQELKFEQ